ncbi:MAG: VIT1/CCC1 transporter family protein [Chloroflexi bacterium]|nr:VIT1/CCC1 transporter family protein [Chloroflexota bacterium]
MLRRRHVETHFSAPERVKDIILGVADGLTVPFALAAGLSGVVNSTAIIIVAGLAEIAAGSIAMGLGGYLASKSDADHYQAERRREQWEIANLPEVEESEVSGIFQSYGLTAEESSRAAGSLRQRPEAWIDFMMRFELGLERPSPRRAIISGLTIGGAYIVGGFIPLGPYIVIPHPSEALVVSVVVTLAALAILGYAKGLATTAAPLASAFQTVLIGGIAATAAFALARLIS